MLISLAEYAKKNNKSQNAARDKANRGTFKTAQKIGRDWVIDSEEPWIDYRYKQTDEKGIDKDDQK